MAIYFHLWPRANTSVKGKKLSLAKSKQMGENLLTFRRYNGESNLGEFIELKIGGNDYAVRRE